MDLPAEILRLMSRFLGNSVSAREFADRYSTRWKELVAKQDEAVARHPTVGENLMRLRKNHRSGGITTEQYLEGVQRQYELLEGLELSPASEASDILDNLFVQSDAYLAGLGESEGEYHHLRRVSEEPSWDPGPVADMGATPCQRLARPCSSRLGGTHDQGAPAMLGSHRRGQAPHGRQEIVKNRGAGSSMTFRDRSGTAGRVRAPL